MRFYRNLSSAFRVDLAEPASGRPALFAPTDLDPYATNVFKNRTHAVTFRLAENEFEELTKAAVSQGARSISDFARAAVMGQVAMASGGVLAREDLEAIAKRLDAFDLTLKDLKTHVLQILTTAPQKAQQMKTIPPRRVPQRVSE